MRSVEEIVFHLSHGRVQWFQRINAPGAEPLVAELDSKQLAKHSAAELVDWLEKTWVVVNATLEQWTVDDLTVTFEMPYQGTLYAVSRQWVIWRIMAHDIHHGGQLSEMLAMQGIVPTELTLLGGHLTEPEVVSKLA
jgi:uncharacterized damage-inducible protein DinB